MASLRILLVDDDLIERKAIQRAIGNGSQKHAVTEVHSAEEALSLLSNVRFDVILMDYHLPGMSGIEAIVKLRELLKLRHAPILMVSHNEDQEIAVKCINAGAQDFVLKTEVTPDRIRRAINQSCQRHAKEQKIVDNYEQVKVLAERDRLTGLHNRHYFNKVLSQRLQNPNLSPENMVAVLLMDLNKFKQVNDNLGHDIGDQLLIAITSRFIRVCRGNELSARLGGDEFVFLAEQLSCPEEAQNIAKRLAGTFAEPFIIDTHEINCGCSIGVALAPIHSRDPQKLLRFADMAMYHSKNHADTKFSIFESENIGELLDNDNPDLQLTLALESPEKHFDLHFHPVFDTKLNRVWGFESRAIVTRDPTLSHHSLRELASHQGCIRSLGFWQLRSTLAEFGTWLQSCIGNKPRVLMTFEVNSLQLSDPNFFAFVEITLQKYAIDPSCVVFTMTENVFSSANEITKETIETLANMGTRIAVRDFGAGQSSLTLLLKFPIHLIELAPTVIHQSINDISPYRKLLTHIQAFMTNLDIAVAVRGISNEKELRLCESLGFSLLQCEENFKPMVANEALAAINQPLTLCSKPGIGLCY